MKLRRMFVAAILIVAIACVGVGYAAMNDTINFTGNITYDADFNLAWTAVNDTAGDLEITDNIDPRVGVPALTVTLDTTDWVVDANEVNYTFQATVTNTSKYDAESVTVTEVTTSGLGSSYVCTATLPDGVSTIPAGGSVDVTITIDMLSYPEADITAGGTFTFDVTAAQVTT